MTQKSPTENHCRSDNRALYCPARCNPLAVVHTDRLAFEFTSGDWRWHLQKLERSGFRGTICGPHGSGKTTLLDQLHDRLLCDGHPCLRTRPPQSRRDQSRFLLHCLKQTLGTVLLVDSAEQLHPWNWWRLVRGSARRGQGLIATVHRPSLLLPLWVTCRTDEALFLRLMQRLVPDADSGWQAKSVEAFHRHRGNIRDAFRELYDQVREPEYSVQLPAESR